MSMKKGIFKRLRTNIISFIDLQSIDAFPVSEMELYLSSEILRVKNIFSWTVFLCFREKEERNSGHKIY